MGRYRLDYVRRRLTTSRLQLQLQLQLETTCQLDNSKDQHDYVQDIDSPSQLYTDSLGPVRWYRLHGLHHLHIGHNLPVQQCL